MKKLGFFGKSLTASEMKSVKGGVTFSGSCPTEGAACYYDGGLKKGICEPFTGHTNCYCFVIGTNQNTGLQCPS